MLDRNNSLHKARIYKKNDKNIKGILYHPTTQATTQPT